MFDPTEQLLKDFAKEYGNIVGDGQSVIDAEPEVVSFSPAFDIGLSGGIQKGSLIIFSGKAKGGKTTSLLSFAVNCQAAGMTVWYMNVEHRLKIKNVMGIKGLNYKKPHFYIIQSNKEENAEDDKAPKKIALLTAQDYLKMSQKILMTVPNSLIIFDSFSMLLDAAELDGGIGTSTRGGGAKLLAQFCRDVAPLLPLQKSIVAGILHLMANTSGFGASTVEKSGNAVQYQLDVKARVKKTTEWKAGNEIIGQIVIWDVVESALGPPGRVVESYIRYGTGIDCMQERIKIATDLSIIEKAGAWYTLLFMQDHLSAIPAEAWNAETMKKVKAHGEEKLYQLLLENPKWTELMQKRINQMAGV